MRYLVDSNVLLRLLQRNDPHHSTIRQAVRDGSVTDKPRNYNLPITEWDEQEAWDHYSANYEWLQMFIDFCRRCEGFKSTKSIGL